MERYRKSVVLILIAVFCAFAGTSYTDTSVVRKWIKGDTATATIKLLKLLGLPNSAIGSDSILILRGDTVKTRTRAQILSDIGALPSCFQNPLMIQTSGTGYSGPYRDTIKLYIDSCENCDFPSWRLSFYNIAGIETRILTGRKNGSCFNIQIDTFFINSSADHVHPDGTGFAFVPNKQSGNKWGIYAKSSNCPWYEFMNGDGSGNVKLIATKSDATTLMLEGGRHYTPCDFPDYSDPDSAATKMTLSNDGWLLSTWETGPCGGTGSPLSAPVSQISFYKDTFFVGGSSSYITNQVNLKVNGYAYIKKSCSVAGPVSIVSTSDPAVYITTYDNSHRARIRYKNGINGFAIRDDSLGADKIIIDSGTIKLIGDVYNTGSITVGAGTGAVASGGYYIDTGHTGETGGGTNGLSFPSGLYDSTAIPISILYKTPGSGLWESGEGSGTPQYLATSASQYSLYYPNNANYHSAKYKVIFQKIVAQCKP
jgi:hypothetical protein